ncbi:glycosyltransferase [Larkinella rosea]|uniref:Glycosyltransferase n=1 Tax=Larkinella rosea TaxID=2025312 RepID=A0A3P1BDM4_9BACT|nr:glycosyltransferase [Larkinella rosea]RRA99209.1 glycosyltransferase [Larkinella rosea]
MAFYADPIGDWSPECADSQKPLLSTSSAAHHPPVSIIVCAWNELGNLQTLLPLLNEQVYPTFEILIMDDRSSDGSRAFLEQAVEQFEHVRFIRIDREHDHVTPKKYALTTGIRNATHDIILLTDADCQPVGECWLAGMVAHLADSQKQIVLGFGPYERRRDHGWINRLIRYETLFTAVQYFSMALAGRPYMGVGRNLMYRRKLFLDNKGFYSHIRVLGGDDDLFINEVATARNVAISAHPATFTYSKPKETFAEWWHQKRRHLSVGKYYKTRNKIWLGLLSMSHVLTWLTGPVVVLITTIRLINAGLPVLMNQPDGQFLLAVTGLFLFRLLAFWVIVGRISHRLGHTVNWITIPALDLVMGVYYAIMGVITLKPRSKNRRMTWK